MGKVNELSVLTEELRKCGEVLIGIADELTNLFSTSKENEKQSEKKDTAKEKASKEKVPTLEEVRAVLAEKSRQGFTSEVKNLLKKHGADKLSEIDPTEYKSLLADAEVMGNA